MPELAAAGPWTLAVTGLRDLLANVPFFQTLTGSADAAAAKKRILFGFEEFAVSAWSVDGAGAAVIQLATGSGIAVGDVVTVEELDARVNGAQTVTAVSGTQLSFTVAAPDEAQDLQTVDWPAWVFPAQRPFAVISLPAENMEEARVAIGTGSYAGQLEIRLDASITAGYQNDFRNANLEMMNTLGQVVAGIRALSETDVYMIVNSVRPNLAEIVAAQDQIDNRVRYESWVGRIVVDWGFLQ